MALPSDATSCDTLLTGLSVLEKLFFPTRHAVVRNRVLAEHEREDIASLRGESATSSVSAQSTWILDVSSLSQP